MAKADLTAQRLRELLSYNPETGVFTWLARNSNRAKIGDTAGNVALNGYLRIGIDGRVYYAHRLAWLHVTGSWPQFQIDHMNGKRADNRLANLRDASNQVNAQNLRVPPSHNTSGFLGVSWDKGTSKWCASLKLNGVRMHLGYFPDKQQAHAVYLHAKRLHHAGNTL